MFLVVTIISCIMFLFLTLFFTLKTITKESIISAIFANKFAFIIIYGIFTLFMIIGLALTYDIYDNIFPVWMLILSLGILFGIMLICGIYLALKISRSSSFKIYQAPGSSDKSIPTIIVLEDIIQVEGGVEGEVLENVKFFPGGRVVRSFSYGDNERPRRVFIESDKVHYHRDNINYLKGNLIPSRDPRYDIEVSMMGFNPTKEMHDLAEKMSYYRDKYFSIKGIVTDMTDAYKNMGTQQKQMSESMAEGVRHLLEKINVQYRGSTDWERKAELERIGLTKKELRKLDENKRELDELRRKGE